MYSTEYLTEIVQYDKNVKKYRMFFTQILAKYTKSVLSSMSNGIELELSLFLVVEVVNIDKVRLKNQLEIINLLRVSYLYLRISTIPREYYLQ